MCGIAGYLDLARPPEEKVLLAMERALEHRGPDEGRIWRSGPCGLVHRRLRVIDLSAAASQPMSNADGRLWVVFNGEIYNFGSLREELRNQGCHFKSASDTEVILHGYERWGTDLFRRLRGMFSIALWNMDREELTLARDRLGKKPLYYIAEAHRFIYGSELPVFRCVPDLKLAVSKQGLREYVEYGYVLSPGSILERVLRLPAGHFAIWNRGNLRLEKYWSLPTAPPVPARAESVQQVAAALEGHLRDAVSCRLQSDVPLGCFLSGGIDSSLVAALTQESLNGRLETYTVGFEDSGMNEAGHAKKIAQHLGTRHHELMVSQQAVLSEFKNVLALASEPIGDDSFVPTYLICRETRRHVTVAISGDGGDELFAGYTKYSRFLAGRRWQESLPFLWKSLSGLPLPDRVRKGLEALATRSPLELARWLSTLWKRTEVDQLLIAPKPAAAGPDGFDRVWGQRPGFPEIEQWMLTDMETYLEGDILTKVDRASMAVALETRSPFLDHQLVEQTLKWRCHADPQLGGKAILKTLLSKYVPESLFVRPKQGFGMPIDQWLRGSLRPILEEYTASNRIRRRGLFQGDFLTAKVREHLSGRRNFARKLYAIIAFEIWADQFFGEGTALS